MFPEGLVLGLHTVPVAVIVEFIIAAQSGETAQADAIREEDLSPCIHPHL